MKVDCEIREAVRQAIDQEALIELCSRLVQMNSVVENDAAEEEIASFVAGYFRELGLDVRLVD